MSVHLVSRAIAEPEVNLIQREQVVREPSVRTRVLYDLDDGQEDQQVAIGRGVVVAVLLSAPLWVLLGVIVYLIK